MYTKKIFEVEWTFLISTYIIPPVSEVITEVGSKMQGLQYKRILLSMEFH